MQHSLELPSADPGRLHTEGLTVRDQLELARESVADFLGAQPHETVFTSSATEAIASVIWGQTTSSPGSVIVSAAEHSSVRLAAERTGRSVLVPIDRTGRVDPEDVAAAIDGELRAGRNVSLACCQLGNHDVGTIQPVAAIALACRARGVPLLVDAAQAAGHVTFEFDAGDATFAAISGHKLGGPAGSGALLVRQGARIEPLLVGGAQERARRAGLENTVSAVGLGAACAELSDTISAEATAARDATGRLRDMFETIDGVEVFGPSDPDQRLPHLVCVGLADIEPQEIVLELDRAGIAAHAGSACTSGAFEPSPVLAAMGVDDACSLRLSVGWHTSDDDVDAAVAAVPDSIKRLRSPSSA